ncbi:nucleoside-diphosphate kinase [Terribacillus saccharophilus]|jgi:nucleoside-diphosphate kinase|uniref:Nucleoside diphosphate kinase n=2 Tax=Terribacillus saccharophilus TaxID=361277 RepID=A0A075LIZ6_9BACI|nr:MULTISPECIES: nucleoside-diphosphate kinase [Terribacillus]AIF66655.1 nucleoside diphosphate kinase [Terribacillus goriensis]MCM3224642.1 nucleoside-diphosphate kinase [Terribacillus saccharophilus]MEC0283462.1 nucleoside-diphosphate kinase [Terribacillus saccharophilus]MEC0290418.1 nucleoside-diphosphate kinase [Terribacillus saccharophilus]PAD36773.1 nucleoside-diphosphate kinase [Terribacillus saccharophilus]
MEKTFLMVKPDGVQRGLIGEIVTRFEKKGLKLLAGKIMVVTEEQAKTHYIEHESKPFFGSLISYITSGPVFAMVWEGKDSVALTRSMIGATKPTDAAPGTIRGDYAVEMSRNLIHGSDSVESAEREIANMFKADELVSYEQATAKWLYE